MPQKRDKTKKTKKEMYYEKNKKAFNETGLSKQNLFKYPIEKQKEYLEREIAKKYNKDKININCMECGYSVYFNDTGYITDEELLEHTKPYFKHK